MHRFLKKIMVFERIVNYSWVSLACFGSSDSDKNGVELLVVPIINLLFNKSIWHWCLFNKSNPEIYFWSRNYVKWFLPIMTPIGWFSMTEKVLLRQSLPIWTYAVWIRPKIFCVPTPLWWFQTSKGRRYWRNGDLSKAGWVFSMVIFSKF